MKKVTINDLKHQAFARNNFSVKKNIEIQNRIVVWPLNWVQRCMSIYYPIKLLLSNLCGDSGVLNLVNTLPESQLNALKQTPLQINQHSLLPSLEHLAGINFRVSRVLAESHQGQVLYLTTVAMVYADDTFLEMAGEVLCKRYI